MKLRILASLTLIGWLFACDAQAKVAIREVISPKGIKAWFIEEPNLPLVSISFSFSAGTAYDPENKQGLASLASQMLIEGTAKLTSSELKHYLQDKAVLMAFGVELDRLTGTFRASLEELPQAASVLKDILTTSRLNQHDYERIRRNNKATLENELKMPETKLALTHKKMLIGNHPYARFASGMPAMLKDISVDDLRAFYQRHFTKDSLVIGVCGKISEQALGQLLDQIFGNLPEKATFAALPDVKTDFTARQETIHTNNPQAIVYFSHPGLGHREPDFLKMYMLNHIIGGNTSSRLWKEVREKRGLVYDIGTTLTIADKLKTLFGSLGSENSKVNEAIQLVKQVWQDVRGKGVTQEELDEAKSFLIGVFPMNFTSSLSIASSLQHYQIYGLSRDYFLNRTEIINAISLQDINDFAKKFIDPNKLVFTIAGNPSQTKTNPVK